MSTYHLQPGFEWNPLQKYRNIPCPCGSKKKAKKCCGMHETCSEDLAKKLKAFLKVWYSKNEK